MDPQSANNLDPKLKATYDRVMGTTTAPAGGPVPVQPTPGVPPVASQVPAAQPTPAPTGATPPPPLPTDVLSFQAAIQQPAAQPAATPAAPIGVIPQQTSTLLKALYIIGGVVFFVIYTIVWIKIFNLPLPF